MTCRARPGQGARLAELLLAVAGALRDAPGCELYVVGHDAADRDVISVYEAWTSQEQLDAALAGAGEDAGGPRPEEVTALLDGAPQRTDVTPLGGVGLDAPPDGYTKGNLDEFPDVAAGAGFGEIGEARFPTDAVGAAETGFSLHTLRPGRRQAFGHRHARAEELYVVLSGSGRVKIDDDLVELTARDVVRIGPRQIRALEAGEDGLEVLAVGPRRRGDGAMVPGWWTD
jgi:mannose-6-phosphate isomerase-like protein (cupin superfamily)